MSDDHSFSADWLHLREPYDHAARSGALVQQLAELHLSPGAARLHVREHLLEVADAVREGLHLAESLVDGLQALAHLLEGLAEALLQRALELLVDRGAHLVELQPASRSDVPRPVVAEGVARGARPRGGGTGVRGTT